MTYEHIVAGTFISRPNRFIAHVETGNRTVVCHVKNTGRCRELLIPGVTVILEFHPDAVLSGRKTEYDLIGVYKNGLLINMDSQAPNKAAWEWLVSLGGGQYTEKNHYPLGSYVPFDIRREVTHGDSRFDLAFSLRNRDTKAVSPAFMEVKGVTLEENGLALFPDAPTKRGIKHLKGLIRAHEEGYEAYVLFVIQMKGILGFTPNDITHPAFGETLRQAREVGVHVLAYDCLVNPDTMTVDSPVKVMLD
jgi:sugar fermentation stimulation protein A